MNVTDIAPIHGHEAERLSSHMARELIDLVSDLSPEEWSSPTDCDLWSVRDHIAHQVGWHEAVLSFPELMRQFGGAVRRTRELGNVIDAQNQVQVDARRGLATDELVSNLERTYGDAATRRRKLGGLLGWIPAYSSYLGGWINVSYITDAIFPRDIYMHRVDIARATGRELRLGDPEHRLIEDIVRDWFGRTKENVRLVLTGPAGGTYESAGEPAVTFTADAVEFTRMLFGRAGREVLEISGDRATAERALSVYFPV